jgi:2-aminobenzoate-CoA ligase
MSGIPESYLPPRELWPARVYLPEQQYPERLNSTEELLDKQVAGGHGARPAILFQDQRITYADLLARVNRAGNVLRSLGIGEFDRIIIRAPNIPDAVVSNLAAIKIGAVSVPSSPLLSGRELAYVARHSEATALVVFAAMLPEVEKVRAELPTIRHILVIGGSPEEIRAKGFLPLADLAAAASAHLEPVRHHRHDVSVLLYTSGTTGLPKGTVHLMEEPLCIADTFGRYGWQVREDDVIAGPAPMGFAAGYGAVAAIPYRFGAAASLIARFTPEAMFETIQQHRATILTILPTSYRKMLQVPDAEHRYDLRSVRLCTGGGEPLGAKTFEEWRARFGLPIYEGFGTSEMFYVFLSAAVTSRPRPGSTGTVVPGYEARIVGEDGTECSPGEIGRLIVRGPTGTLYWRDVERQRAAVRDGWNYVGDYAYADADRYVWFVSRDDDLIKSSGYRIGPEEIEDALREHPLVGDAGVIGVPDPIRGQNVKALVLLKEPIKEPALAGPELEMQLLAFLRDRIATYKLPREFAFVPELPRTVTGKLLRRVLREREKAGTAGG